MLDRTGVFAALGAYLLWGFFPMYWHYLTHIPSLEIMSHRVIWSLFFYLGFTLFRKKLSDFKKLRKHLKALTWTAILISTNWLLYVWAVTHGHVMESSLGYFINPLISVALGTLILKEQLKRNQKIALIFATIGVLWLTFDYGRPPWIALTLAVSFAVYGYLKKTIPADASIIFVGETVLLLPFAIIAASAIRLTEPTALSTTDWILLAGGGVITGVPLLLFGVAAQKLPLSTLGFVQYLAPTLQFLTAFFFFNEPLESSRLFGFCLIWFSLAIFLLGNLRFKKARLF